MKSEAMVESFQDESWIQDFETDSSIAIRQIIIASLISFQIIWTHHLNLKLFNFIGILQVLKFEFLKFRILEILNLSLP